jgi:hypothetical protein
MMTGSIPVITGAGKDQSMHKLISHVCHGTHQYFVKEHQATIESSPREKIAESKEMDPIRPNPRHYISPEKVTTRRAFLAVSSEVDVSS